MVKTRTLNEICQEHIDSLTPEERAKEYLFLLEQEKFWKDYAIRQKELREKFSKIVSDLESKYFSMVPGDQIKITIDYDKIINFE